MKTLAVQLNIIDVLIFDDLMYKAAFTIYAVFPFFRLNRCIIEDMTQSRCLSTTNIKFHYLYATSRVDRLWGAHRPIAACNTLYFNGVIILSAGHTCTCYCNLCQNSLYPFGMCWTVWTNNLLLRLPTVFLTAMRADKKTPQSSTAMDLNTQQYFYRTVQWPWVILWTICQSLDMSTYFWKELIWWYVSYSSVQYPCYTSEHPL